MKSGAADTSMPATPANCLLLLQQLKCAYAVFGPLDFNLSNLIKSSLKV